ncbi:MAG TPA: hypothetical protein VGV15_10540, partial [Terriglobales bacterium]|nr:hypothetical protein [Terriglobales bacterium]
VKAAGLQQVRTWFAPTGSNRSGGGGNEAVGAPVPDTTRVMSNPDPGQGTNGRKLVRTVNRPTHQGF